MSETLTAYVSFKTIIDSDGLEWDCVLIRPYGCDYTGNLSEYLCSVLGLEWGETFVIMEWDKEDKRIMIRAGTEEDERKELEQWTKAYRELDKLLTETNSECDGEKGQK